MQDSIADLRRRMTCRKMTSSSDSSGKSEISNEGGRPLRSKHGTLRSTPN